MFHVDNGVVKSGQREGYQAFPTYQDAIDACHRVGASYLYGEKAGYFVCRGGSRPSLMGFCADAVPTPDAIETAIDAIFA